MASRRSQNMIASVWRYNIRYSEYGGMKFGANLSAPLVVTLTDQDFFSAVFGGPRKKGVGLTLSLVSAVLTERVGKKADSQPVSFGGLEIMCVAQELLTQSEISSANQERRLKGANREGVTYGLHHK